MRQYGGRGEKNGSSNGEIGFLMQHQGEVIETVGVERLGLQLVMLRDR